MREKDYDVRSSLKEPGWTAANKIDAENLKDNPRRLGKGRIRLVDPAPLKPGRKFRRGRIHRFLWRRSHVVTTRMRNVAARNDEKPFRTESSSSSRFRAWANRSYRKGIRLLLRISTVRQLWRFKNKKLIGQIKTPKGGQKGRAYREGHKGWASHVKNFQEPAMLKTTPLDCERKQLEREEARPVVLGERTVKSGG